MSKYNQFRLNCLILIWAYPSQTTHVMMSTVICREHCVICMYILYTLCIIWRLPADVLNAVWSLLQDLSNIILVFYAASACDCEKVHKKPCHNGNASCWPFNFSRYGSLYQIWSQSSQQLRGNCWFFVFYFKITESLHF